MIHINLEYTFITVIYTNGLFAIFDKRVFTLLFLVEMYFFNLSFNSNFYNIWKFQWLEIPDSAILNSLASLQFLYHLYQK